MASFGDAYGPVPSALFRRLEQHCASFTDSLIFVGSELRALYLQAGVASAAKSRVIRSPIELRRFLDIRTLDEAAREGIRRARLPAASHGTQVLMVGALEARKRHVLALRSLWPLMQDGDIHLVIAGEGPERGRIAAEAARLGVGERVNLLGHVEAPEQLMAACDLFLHTSSVEGVAQSVVQALAAGMRVVATEVTGLREADEKAVIIAKSEETEIVRAVKEALRAPPKVVSSENFAPWSHHAVEQSILTLHEDLTATQPAIGKLALAKVNS
jgi:glycosyltransferase involved in cell wall biosynthesis